MDDLIYDGELSDVPNEEFCDDCMCFVELDAFGDKMCMACNPFHSDDEYDEDGDIQELNFHEV